MREKCPLLLTSHIPEGGVGHRKWGLEVSVSLVTPPRGPIDGCLRAHLKPKV